MSQLLVLGVDCHNKPFPKIVQRHKHLIERVLNTGRGNVLDIGAGRGRFLGWFIENVPSLRRYVAVEPYAKFVARLRDLEREASSRGIKVAVIHDTWQNARSVLLSQFWDIIIAWDVAMFLDMRHVWNTSSLKEALVREIAEWIRHSRMLLLSFYPVKSGLPEISGYVNGRKNFKIFHEIVTKALEVAGCGLVLDRYHYQNYIIVNF